MGAQSPWRNHPAVYVVSGITALSLFGDALLYSILPLYAGDLGIPLLAVGIILSMNRWVRLGTNPLAARVYDRHGLFRPLLGAMILAVLSTFLYSRAWGLVVFLLARALWGLSWSHLRLGSLLVILSTSGSSLGLAIGTHHALTRLGSAFTSVVGGLLVDRGGYQWGLTIMTILSSLGVFLVVGLRRLLPSGLEDTKQRTTAQQGENLAVPELSPSMCYAGGFTVSFVSAGVIVSSLSLVLQQRLGDAVSLGSWTLGIATISGLLFAVRWTSSLVIAPLVGRLIDLTGRVRVFRLLTLVMVVALLIFGGVLNPLVTVVVACLLFFAGNSLEVVFDTAIGDTTYQEGEEATTTRLSRYASFYDLGAASGPVVAYYLGSRIGFEWSFYLGAGLMFILLAIDVLDLFPMGVPADEQM